jgi:adenosylmethionine-8-amino-7-oxononanoate aminotransferase
MVSRFLHPFARPTREDFVCIIRGDGALVYDDQGNEYVDGMASLWYANVGHGRAEVADAVAAQMKQLAAYSTFDPFTTPQAESLAERLSGLATVVDDPRVFFTSSGSEAVDSALKLARIAQVQAGHPERTMVLSRSFAYHGVTYGGLSAQGLPPNQAGFGPLLEGFENVPNNDIEAMSVALERAEGRVAAVITEPVQGAGGVRPPVDEYLPELRRLCDRHGAYLVVDEVICAFGRLGTWFGSERYDIRPDLVTFAKGVTSGYVPLGGVVVGNAVRSALEADPTFVLRHGHTYSGHPAACAAAHAVLDITEREQLLDRSVHVGNRLAGGLRSLLADGLVAEVRGDGAVWAVALQPAQDPTAIRDAMLGRGVITRAVGADTLTFCPPLVISDEHLDRIVDTLAASLPAA